VVGAFHIASVNQSIKTHLWYIALYVTSRINSTKDAKKTLPSPCC